MRLKPLVKRIVFWSVTPCVSCGVHMRPRQFPIIWDSLAEQWELTPELRESLDLREGSVCAFCGTNWRVRHLAHVLLDEIGIKTGHRFKTVPQLVRSSAADGFKIAEVNELPGLHKYLEPLPGLTYSEYGGENSQNLMALSYADDTFDLFLTSDTLEHVPDFDLALSEIHRVLKPGGKHIFTIPIIWDRPTRQRAEMVDGGIVHHLPPSHHGGPDVSPDDYLVFNEFGGDAIRRIEASGFNVRLLRDHRNSLVVTIVAEKAHGS